MEKNILSYSTSTRSQDGKKIDILKNTLLFSKLEEETEYRVESDDSVKENNISSSDIFEKIEMCESILKDDDKYIEFKKKILKVIVLLVKKR